VRSDHPPSFTNTPAPMLRRRRKPAISQRDDNPPISSPPLQTLKGFSYTPMPTHSTPFSPYYFIAFNSCSTAASSAATASSNVTLSPPHVYIASPNIGSRRNVLPLNPEHFCAARAQTR